MNRINHHLRNIMYEYAVSVSAERIRIPEWRKALAASKFQRIELSCGNDMTPHEAEELTGFCRNDKLLGGITFASIHLPFWPFEHFPFPAGEREREEIAAHLSEFIRITAPLKARNYTFHASIEPNAPETRGELLRKTRSVVAALGRTAGEIGASLNVELLPRTCIGNTPEEMLALTDDMPESVGICFDVNHLTYPGSMERVPEFIDRLRDRIQAFHLSDYDGVDEAHWLPGLGLLNWPEVMAAIRRVPGKPLLIFETAVLKPLSGRPREITPAQNFRNLEHAAFYLENCSELESRVAELRIP